MAIQTKHFSVTYPKSRLRRYDVPGVSGPILKQLNATLAIITQRGYADPGSETEITENKGNPAVTVAVDALLQGVFTGCYKSDAQVDSEQTGEGGLVQYTIIWEKIIA